MVKPKPIAVLWILALAGWATAQAYLDGQKVLELMNASRYEEAYALSLTSPERYAQWTAHVLSQRLVPETRDRNGFEATAKGAEYACRYASVNRESEAFCYYLLNFLLRWKDADPRAASALAQAKVPSLGLKEIDERVSRLAKDGVPFAMLREAQGEASLKRLAESFPYSLGGVSATSRLALLLWEGGKHAEAVSLALKIAGFSGTPAGVLAYGEYHSIGVKKDQESACRRSLFWARRTTTAPTLYTLGLCYRDGAGGFPKDLPLAYGIFWTAREYSGYPGFTELIEELEKVLTPEQRKEGRQRGSKLLAP